MLMTGAINAHGTDYRASVTNAIRGAWSEVLRGAIAVDHSVIKIAAWIASTEADNLSS